MMKVIVSIVLLTVPAAAQGLLPWGSATSIPLLASDPNNAMFYVSSYHWSGNHTDYDMARQAADSYLVAHPGTPVYLILSPALTQTCDDVQLPSVPRSRGTVTSVSIIGYGSNSTRLTKRSGCMPRVATLLHPDAAAGYLTGTLYQGFTVDANHVDPAACGFYGMSDSTLLDLACGNASAGSDHEAEFGNLDPNALGLDSNISIYNFKTFDTVGAGRGAVLSLGWNGSTLSSVSVVSGGTKQYTQQYTRAQVVGPDLSSCTAVPTVKPLVSGFSSSTYANLPTINYGYLTGATITNPGRCAQTTRLYLLIQDGVPVTYGMKFTYFTGSHVWNLEPTGNATYGEAWMGNAENNEIIGEHPYTNQTVSIAEYGVGNQHLNTFFDSPGQFGAAIFGASGAFINPVFSWDAGTYLASSGYYFGGSTGAYKSWTIQNSQCTDSTDNYASLTIPQGPIAETDSTPSGVALHDIERCDGTKLIDWETQVTPQ